MRRRHATPSCRTSRGFTSRRGWWRWTRSAAAAVKAATLGNQVAHSNAIFIVCSIKLISLAVVQKRISSIKVNP
uniref:Uncharacterized protein n=1 Tax=Setaria viridis TaxID=4556 RepID=A0A4U6ULM0_SETVI|nr:hypothetical protein SEVIR_5G347600v2 [Setaria viridis]